MAFAVVGDGKVGVEVDGLLKGGERFLVAIEVVEGTALIKPLLF